MAQKRGQKPTERFRRLTRQQIFQALLIAVMFIIGGVLILIYQSAAPEYIKLGLGNVTPNDVLAPQQFSYVSEIQTDAARERARNSIPTIDSRPDTGVARKQNERLRRIFDYIDTVRADPYGTLAEKSKWIEAIPDLSLSDIVVDQILIIDEETWAATKQEASAVLNQAMRTVIKENQLSAARRQLPTLVSLDTPDEEANIIVSIVEDMIQPNTFPDEARTEAERRTAAETIEDIRVNVEENELIISAGEVVGPATYEKLQALAKLHRSELSGLEDFLAPIILMVLITAISGAYLFQHTLRILADSKRLTLLAGLLLVFIILAKFMIPGHTFAYLYPMAALTMLVATLIDVQFAFIAAAVLALLAGYMAAENPQEVVAYLILSGWTGALSLGRSQRITNLLWAGVYVSIVNIGVIAIFNLPLVSVATTSAGFLMLQGLINGTLISAGLALIALFVLGSLLGITTSIHLFELGRPTHPLLRQLLLKAPGTYAHSLMVSNLGEQAAERIGADALLVRVMAYYHDIGKIQRPYFFVENQPEGINVHQKLEPQISAQIIISHVSDGLELAQKYRLPPAIKAGIAQHQGTDLVKYFYYQAIKAAEEKNTQVDESHFRYPGPKPQTRETGILMLADISETSVRALKPGSAGEINEIVKRMISDKLDSGELNDCDLTIADLNEIRKAFVDILQGVHHPRIKYPDQIKAEEAKAEAAAEKDEPDQEPSPPKTKKDEAEKSRGAAAPPSLQPLPADAQTRPSRLVRRE